MKLFQGSSALSSISLQFGSEDQRNTVKMCPLITCCQISKNSELPNSAILHLINDRSNTPSRVLTQGVHFYFTLWVGGYPYFNAGSFVVHTCIKSYVTSYVKFSPKYSYDQTILNYVVALWVRYRLQLQG